MSSVTHSATISPGVTEVGKIDVMADMSSVSTRPDLSTVTTTVLPDPKYGSSGRYSSQVLEKRGPLTKTMVSSRVIAADDSTETTTTSVNTKTTTSLFTRSTNKIVSTSPMGRVTTTFLDAVKDRAASMQIGPASGGDPVTLYPTTYSYYAGADIKTGLVNTVSVNTRTTTYTYDANGFVASVTAPDGKVTAYNTRDALGRPTQMTLPGGRVVNMAYDAAGNATTVTPPPNGSPGSSNPHNMTYNAGDLLATYVAPNVSGAARTTTYTYDKDSLLKQLISPVDPGLSKTLTRDGEGRVIEEIEGTRRRTFAYTNGHLTQQRGYVSGTQEVEQNFAFNTGLWTGFDQKLFTGGVKTVTRTNDTFFRLTNVAMTGLTGTLDYGYDDDGLVTNVGGLVATRGNTAGLLKRLERPGLEDETFQYDSYGAVTQMNALQAGVSKGGLSLTYDATSGRILTKTENWNFPSLLPALLSKTWTYTYDTSGRLASASDGGAPVPYTYDTNGNRLTGNPDAQDRVLSQGGTVYTYDNHGNVTTRTVSPQPTQTLTWNGQGGLLSVAQSGSSTVTYVIDPQGRRVGRKLGANLDREWLYDTQLRLVGEVIGTTTSRVYGYLPERHLPVMMRETKSGTTTTYRIYGDHLGSLRAVVKSDGTPVQFMQHDAWGNVLIDTVAANFDRIPFGFAGGQYDENTKLVRFGAREYDATTGRWLSKDEARFGGGWNFYEYAGSDPVNKYDRDGYREQDALVCDVSPPKPIPTPCWDVCDNRYDNALERCGANHPLEDRYMSVDPGVFDLVSSCEAIALSNVQRCLDACRGIPDMVPIPLDTTGGPKQGWKI